MLSGVLALVPAEVGEEARTLAAVTHRSVDAVLLYRQQVPEIYSAVVTGEQVLAPCVTVRPADALRLLEDHGEVELIIEADEVDVLSQNVLVGIGRSQPKVLFLANYDTRPATPGTYRNASGVAALLALLSRLRGSRRHRIVCGFLGAEEPGSFGARDCREALEDEGDLEGLTAVVYVSGLGRRELSIGSPALTSSKRSVATAVRKAAEGDTGCTVCTVAAAPSGIWDCPVITASGPPLLSEYTGLDQPDLLHPRFVSHAVSILERLTQEL